MRQNKKYMGQNIYSFSRINREMQISTRIALIFAKFEEKRFEVN